MKGINVLKVAYLGWLYHGSQIQPSKQTVEGIIEQYIGPGRFTSRTDAGVSAVENLFVMHAPKSLRAVLSKLKVLKRRGIVVWAAGYGVPKILGKRYVYFLPRSLVSNSASNGGKEILEKLVEQNEYKRGGAKPKGPISILIKETPCSFQIIFEARGFGYMQIRRIVGKAFFGGKTAPPEGLLLLRTHVSGVEWVWENFELVKQLLKNHTDIAFKARIVEYITAGEDQQT